MSRRFGVLLRHYWLPATELTYQRTTTRQKPGSEATTAVETVFRKPVKYDSDVCIWRESVNGSEERFYLYNRSKQTFRIRGLMEFTATPENENEARLAAFWHVPVLTPLLPVPPGFQWHVSAEDGFLEFMLESETTIRNMPVVFVKRRGRFPISQNGSAVHREGMTAIALERSVILEDRCRDRFDDGTESYGTLKLIESRLDS